MTYSKPNVRYVDMAIYIDEHVYTNTTEVEDNLIYEYIYHLAIMLARQHKYFKTSDQYDRFGLHVASKVFTRLRNNKQFELDSSNNYKMEKIRSILNYLKSTLYPSKVDFEQDYYSQLLSKQQKDIDYNPDFNNVLTRAVDKLNVTEFRLCLDNIVDCIKLVINRIPNRINSAEFHNVYLSCLLTLLNSITISRKNKKRIFEDLNGNKYYKDIVLKKILIEENDNPVILYHLDSSMKDYILVLVREIKHSLAQELSQALHTHVSSTTNVQDLLLSNIFTDEERP